MTDEIDLAVPVSSLPALGPLRRGRLAVLRRWLARLLSAPQRSCYPATREAFEAAERRLRRFWDHWARHRTEEERWVVAELQRHGVSDVDLLHGSHVVVHDGGALYARLQRACVRARGSSHYRSVRCTQYEIALPGAGVVLFGLDGAGESWFQLESHSTRGSELVFHVIDFIRHVAAGFLNIGPMGTSPRSEKRGSEIRLAIVPVVARGA